MVVVVAVVVMAVVVVVEWWQLPCTTCAPKVQGRAINSPI